MIPVVACITCGRPSLPGRSRCLAHTSKSSSGWARYTPAHPREAAYYSTEHWRVTRREVLERDRDCQLRLQGCTGQSSEVDHIIRPRDGGSHELSNLRGVCRRCHLQRTAEQGKQGNKRAAARRKEQMVPMSGESTSYHEASHAVAAQSLGLPVTYLTIRPHPDHAGRTKFDTDSEGFAKLDDFECAIIKIAGEIGARIAAGATSSAEARFNWFAEGEDAEHARDFIRRQCGEDGELDARQLAQLRAYALLRTRWEAVEEIAAKLQRHTTVLGEEVSQICLAEAARRGARLQATRPPKPRPDRVPKPAKTPRRPSSGDREVRPFTFQIVEKEGMR